MIIPAEFEISGRSLGFPGLVDLQANLAIDQRTFVGLQAHVRATVGTIRIAIVSADLEISMRARIDAQTDARRAVRCRCQRMVTDREERLVIHIESHGRIKKGLVHKVD